MKFNLKLAKEMPATQLNTYISEYFHPLSNGNHCMIVDGEPVIMKQEVIKKTYFDRMTKKANEYYFKENCEIKEIICKLNDPVVSGDNINICPQLKHKFVAYSTFSDEAKAGVELMLSFVNEVWANSKKEDYDYLLNWFANMIQGNKNESILYGKSIQGVGKSTFSTFIKKWVIGNPLCAITGSGPLLSDFNSVLSGKMFVIFEELENSSMADWNNIGNKLKSYSTDERIMITQKYLDPYEIDNMNNYIILTNQDAIKDSEGRRYYIADLNTKYKENHAYFGKLHDVCFNDTVGHAFYCYLKERDVSKFKSMKMPMTAGKYDAISDRLDNVYKFLKSKYIMLNIDLYNSVKAIHLEYEKYCEKHGIKSKSINDFNTKMKEVDIKKYKSNTCYKYKMSHTALLNIAKRDHWISDLDEYNESAVQKSKSVANDDDLDFGVKVDQNLFQPSTVKAIDANSVEEIRLLKEEIACLKQHTVPTVDERYQAIIREHNQIKNIKTIKKIIIKKTIIVKPERVTITEKEMETVFDLFD
jgi:hypothetical protein